MTTKNLIYRFSSEKQARKRTTSFAAAAGGCLIALSIAICPASAQDGQGYSSSVQSLFDAPQPKSSYEFSSMPPLSAQTNQPYPTTVKTVSDDSGAAGVTANAVWNSDPDKMPSSETTGQAVPQPVDDEPSAAAPAKPVNDDHQPIAATNVHRLNHLTWQSFEQRLIDTWGNSLKVSTSEDGRYARAMVPQKNDSDYLPVLIDRGKTLRIAGWNNNVCIDKEAIL